MKEIKLPKGAAMFEVPVYGGRVFICTNREAYNDVHRQIDGGEDAGVKYCRGTTTKLRDRTNSPAYVLGVFEQGDQTLVHELAHLTFWILNSAGVRISHKNDEPFAYLIDALFEKAKEGIRNIRKR